MQKAVERPPSGRREVRKQERRQAILAIAAQSFLENGYAGTSMSAIAAELGGSKGTLWSYFSSKEELFAAVLDDRTAAYRERLEALLDPEQDLRTALRDFCRSFIAKVTDPDSIALHRLITAETPRFPEIGTIFYTRAPEMTRKRIAAFLALHMTKGHLRESDPQRAARALLGMCLAGTQQDILWGQCTRDALQIESEADYVVDLFLRAFEDS